MEGKGEHDVMRKIPATCVTHAHGSDIPAPAWDQLQNLDLWIVDALRRAPHPTHSHLDNTLKWIEKAAPKHAILTNMHNDLDHDTLAGETPDHIRPAYDGMEITIAL